VLAAQSVEKGSVTIDGVSLTITGLGDDWLSVDLIPTTLADTVLGALRIGDEVNLEGDVLGKYVARAAKAPAAVTVESLARAGFI
jgi:riboflavin synthase